MPPTPLNIKPTFFDTLDAKQTMALTKLANWPMDRIAQRLLAAGSATLEESTLNILAYKQFMFMHCLNPATRCAMYSAQADEIWHQHILHTVDYEIFCQSVFGQFIHHTPLTQSEAAQHSLNSDDAWVEKLQRVFGRPVLEPRIPPYCQG